MSLSFLAQGRQSGRQAKPGHSAACSPWLWSHHAAYARFACANCHVEVTRAKSARLFVAKLRCDYADENALPDKAASGRGRGGAGREGYNGLPLEKRNCQLCLLCQQAMSANPVAAPHRSPTARQPVSHQPTVVSYQSFVLSPQSSFLGPPSTVLCPPSAVRCLC